MSSEKQCESKISSVMINYKDFSPSVLNSPQQMYKDSLKSPAPLELEKEGVEGNLDGKQKMSREVNYKSQSLEMEDDSSSDSLEMSILDDDDNSCFFGNDNSGKSNNNDSFPILSLLKKEAENEFI